MKSLKQFISEAKKSNITLAKIKKIVNGIDYDIDECNDGFTLKFEEDDYWDFEKDNLTDKLQKVFDELSKLTTVIRWDDRSWLLVKNKFIVYADPEPYKDIDRKPINITTEPYKGVVGKTTKPEPNKEIDIHKVKSNGLSYNDEELIDLAYSTTYRSSIKNYIKIADTVKARKILQDILNYNEIEWED